jgi:Ser/Thr protein kinase RdoA (MazF antagonist)
MPMQAIHNDANDYNVIMGPDGQLGLIDFGDIVRAPRIVGLATAAAYAATRVAEPVRDICPVIRGYHRRVPLNPAGATGPARPDPGPACP